MREKLSITKPSGNSLNYSALENSTKSQLTESMKELLLDLQTAADVHTGLDNVMQGKETLHLTTSNEPWNTNSMDYNQIRFLQNHATEKLSDLRYQAQQVHQIMKMPLLPQYIKNKTAYNFQLEQSISRTTDLRTWDVIENLQKQESEYTESIVVS
jgi:hypothetical protein